MCCFSKLKFTDETQFHLGVTNQELRKYSTLGSFLFTLIFSRISICNEEGMLNEMLNHQSVFLHGSGDLLMCICIIYVMIEDKVGVYCLNNSQTILC